MLYSERFANQWDTLINSFLADMRKIPAEAVTVRKVNEWFHVYIFRWSSIVETEGILLENTKNEALKSRLLKKMDEFSFREVHSGKKPGFLPGFLSGLTGAVILGILLKMVLHVRFWMIAAEAVIIMALVLVNYAASLDRFTKSESDRVCREYAKQLADYKEILVKICRECE